LRKRRDFTENGKTSDICLIENFALEMENIGNWHQ